LLSYTEHRRDRVAINHLLGNHASFRGAAAPVFGVIDALFGDGGSIVGRTS
jgi:hypothetical protein